MQFWQTTIDVLLLVSGVRGRKFCNKAMFYLFHQEFPTYHERFSISQSIWNYTSWSKVSIMCLKGNFLHSWPVMYMNYFPQFRKTDCTFYYPNLEGKWTHCFLVPPYDRVFKMYFSVICVSVTLKINTISNSYPSFNWSSDTLLYLHI